MLIKIFIKIIKLIKAEDTPPLNKESIPMHPIPIIINFSQQTKISNNNNKHNNNRTIDNSLLCLIISKIIITTKIINSLLTLNKNKMTLPFPNFLHNND
jgi:hypothetical protein